MILGFETRLTLTVTEFDPPRRAVVTLAARPVRGAISTTLEPTANGTKVDRTTDIELHAAFILLSPVLSFNFPRQNRAVSRNWKRLIQAAPPSAPQKP